MKKETIASITTPIGEGGIGVIQVSGPDSLEIVNKIFKGRKQRDLREAESKRLYYGDVYSKGSIVDEVIVNVLREQDSFTGENLVEVNCHGGVMAVKKALECVVSAGAQEVHWRELASRSLTNNKIDLIQNEALLEIPVAKTKLAVKVLIDQYNGALSSYIHNIIEEIENCANTKSSLGPIHNKPGHDSGIRRSFDSVQDDVTLNGVEVLSRLKFLNTTIRELQMTSVFGCVLTSPQKLIITGKT